MINSFVEFTVGKRTATFKARSLLSLACWLVVVLGGMLVTNESYAQTCLITVSSEDRVVVQNVAEFLYIREESNIESEDFGKVYNGDRGVVTHDKDGRYVEKDAKHVWYYVKWDSGKMGWSAGIIEDRKYIATTLETYQKNVIVEALFNGKNHDQTKHNYIKHYQTKHDYNDYGCNANWKVDGELVYEGGGGHAGWDVRTRYEDNETLRNTKFYSLTAGEVANVSDLNTIAIYDGTHTTLYLHALEVEQSIKDKANSTPKGFIGVGTPLGKQGEKGEAEAEHVHIEVRIGRRMLATYSANDTTRDPVPYLYDSVADGTKKFRPWDVNRDGRVNFFDLLKVWQNWGKDDPQCDVNGDGNVDMADCDEIKAHWDDSPVALTHSTQNLLEDQTRLLVNYPNPFNPETWIPYQLAWSTEVSISIHAVDGALVRTLDLGHQPAGLYLQQSRAAYWDGRNAAGEQVASGVYFYTLSAGDFTATRRMLINR